ncbi:uncharacterized protein [Physcomitrium patens]|uniref:BRCT domain-containing protein n=1 Tax=Physcomitrium patens TaxID=3218 RepID=A0A7I4FTK8_PHYPA|nr:uncharacterized protein LOC112284278 isoform X4 [Physcomitrium patens]|eukprot:XP_024379728.1 uncharacterized protein LOC112284278 isoform X4 [Physcomitrella patens]
MEDEESGSLSFNSSDGGSRSWSPSPSHKTNQHVSNREVGYGGMKAKPLLSNEFYSRQFSRQQQEESDEVFEEQSDEERDELEVQRQGQEYAGGDGEEDALESDYDGDCLETQLLEQYNAAYYTKIDHEEKLRCRGALNLSHSAGDNSQRLSVGQINYEETQLLEEYDVRHHVNVEYERCKPMHLPLNVVAHGDYTKGLKNLQHDGVGLYAGTADEAEPTEVIDSDASTEDEGTISTRDKQEAPRKQKPSSEFRQARMCGFEMDLNVRLEEDTDCEYYGKPRNSDSQLVAHTETQLVDDFHGWQGNTQLVSAIGKELLDNICSISIKVAPTDSEDMPCEAKDAFESKSCEPFMPVSTGSMQILMQCAGLKTPSSSRLELPSITTESKVLAAPSVSEASESSPFQNSTGTVRAESMRMAAVEPLQWLPKVKPDDYNFPNSEAIQSFRNRREASKCINKIELPSNEPEWMRDYAGRGDLLMQNNWDQRKSALGSSSRVSVPDPFVSKDSKATNMLTSGEGQMTEQDDVGKQACFSGISSLFRSSKTQSANYDTKSNFGCENSGSQIPLQRRISFGPRLLSPTGSMNYLDSVEPGEAVQAEALDIVDKFVWLNTADASQASPPRKYKKSSIFPLASSTFTNPALQVFEFEDSIVAQRPQTLGNLSLIKEIQAGWKKKAEQDHLESIARKGKEKETDLLPEGQRLSKLLTDNDREKINDPKMLFHAASTKRVSGSLPQDKDEASLDAAITKSSATLSIAKEKERTKGKSIEPVEVADDGLLNVVVNGMQKFSNTGVLRSDEVMEHDGDYEDKEKKVLDRAEILTRRRSEGRNRREHIRVPEAVLLSGNYLSPKGKLYTDCKMEKDTSAARKRRSVNIMLGARSAKKVKSTFEENVDDQDDANENMDNISSPACSGADPMFVVAEKPSSGRRKQITPQDAENDKDGESALVEPEMPQKRKRRKLSEASNLLIGTDDMGVIRGEEGVKTQSLRQLRRRPNVDNRTESISIALVQKKLRSARRSSRGGQGAPITTLIDDGNDMDKEVEQDASAGTCSGSFQRDSNNDELEVNDGSSPDHLEETSDQRASHMDEPFEDYDVGRMKLKRTKSIADVSRPSTPVLQPASFPLVTGRRGRGAALKPEIVEYGVMQCSNPSFVVPAATRGTRMRTVRRRRAPQMPTLAPEKASEFVQEESASVSTEGSLRTRWVKNVSVLFSHGLSEVTLKKQRKIVEKLDGKVTRKAADCTHFVADKFVRTGNMLEAMAGGKFVVTFAWLESCRIANCFIEERNFILQDERKERELGFSMRATILAAQQKSLLQGVRVLLTPNINPAPQVLTSIVHAAGGQVVEEYKGPAPPDSQNEGFCIVLANEDDMDSCAPLLEQGAKVYKPELILSGIISHHLEFSKHLLFENYRGGRH